MLTRIVSMLTKPGRRSHEVREDSGTYGNFDFDYDYDYDNDNDNEIVTPTAGDEQLQKKNISHLAKQTPAMIFFYDVVQ